MDSLKPKALLIFGPPGSGKGTVGSKLAATTGLYHLSTGNIFRGLSPQSPNGRLAAEYSNQGRLVPDEVALQIFARYLGGLVDTNQFDPERHTLLLDGMPRTRLQAELLGNTVDVVKLLVLTIADEEMLVKRILHRAEIENRSDDADEQIVRRRMSEYHAKTEAVLSFYPKSLQAKIEGGNLPMVVFRDALNAVIDAGVR